MIEHNRCGLSEGIYIGTSDLPLKIVYYGSYQHIVFLNNPIFLQKFPVPGMDQICTWSGLYLIRTQFQSNCVKLSRTRCVIKKQFS